MADPVTMFAISMGTTALAGGVSAFGKYQGGQASAGMYQYQAGVAQINKQIASQNADYARTVGEREAQRSGMKTRFERAQTLTTQSGRGIDVTTGSAARVRDSITDVGFQDQSTIRSNAARRAYGYEVEASQEEAKSKMLRTAASNSKKAGIIDTIGSLLGTASSVSSKWLQARQAGVFGSSGSSFGAEEVGSGA